jgi:hypothetical protein
VTGDSADEDAEASKEQALAEQLGVNVATGGGGGVVTVCVTDALPPFASVIVSVTE